MISSLIQFAILLPFRCKSFKVRGSISVGFRLFHIQNPIIITSDSNEKIKLLRNLESAKGRSKNDLIRLEGHRQVIDAINYGLAPKLIVYTSRALPVTEILEKDFPLSKKAYDGIQNIGPEIDVELLNVLQTCDNSIQYQVTESVMRSITDTVNNQGIVAAFEKPVSICKIPFESTFNSNQSKNKPNSSAHHMDNQNSILLVLDGVADPGNVGSLLRYCCIKY
jgi:tRNA G18 (ribose-2'-O)-methylase SpoU